jgi:hypothetical protein
MKNDKFVLIIDVTQAKEFLPRRSRRFKEQTLPDDKQLSAQRRPE